VTAVVPARPTDVRVIAALTEEMDRFYGATEFEALDTRISQITDAVFGHPPAAHVLLASNGSRPVGFASYSFLWPAVGLTKSLYLKELYVTESARRSGIGRLIMRKLFDVARERGCSRVEWTTDRGNPDAQQFYESIGMRENASKIFYRLDGGGLGGQE